MALDLQENNTIIMPKGDYIMKNAISVITGKTRTDKDYPWWIGMTMRFYTITPEWGAVFRYVKDNQGNEEWGGMHTSPVMDVKISNDEKHVEIETVNTIYKFEKVKED